MAFVIIGHNGVAPLLVERPLDARCFLGAMKSKVKCVCGGGIGPTHAFP
jgi:hypothetical protein